MNPAEIDPSLCSGQRTLESLDDGFSPPPPQLPEAASAQPGADDGEPSLGTKSPF